MQEGAATRKEQLHACPHCPWLFSAKSHLLIHVLNHKQTSEEEPKGLHLATTAEEHSGISETHNKTFDEKDKNIEPLLTRIK